MQNFRVLASILTDFSNFLPEKERKGERKGERKKERKKEKKKEKETRRHADTSS